MNSSVSAYANKSDSELVSFIGDGNDLAFAELVSRHTDRFFALAFRTLRSQGDAEDIVQAAFIKFWQRPHLCNPDKAKFTTWFYRVVINACHDLQRQTSRQSLLQASFAEQSNVCVDSELTSIEHRQTADWRRKTVEAGIRALPASQQDSLNLVVYSEISQREAAEILGVSLKALESTLHRAKKNLHNYVEKMALSKSNPSSKTQNRNTKLRNTQVYDERY
ncbi:MAG: RNA polymerase sigma-70 factor (ECF subfamily) [Arenicella sp.]|jgi:RNA polymerase sigma-70 factor (ECF subfamily)